MAISVGTVAPAFTLNNSKNEATSLASFAGQPVVLLFFPLAFTSVCTEELCTMRDNMKQYEDLGAQILGISVDSPFTLAEYKRKESLNFPLLSDFNKEASTAYGAIYDEFFGMKGVSKRSAFVVDKAGKVVYSEILEDAGKQPNFAAIQDSLKSLS